MATKRIEEALGRRISDLAHEQQQWSASGAVHLCGTWRATGTPVVIKIGVDRNQLYWTRRMAATART